MAGLTDTIYGDILAKYQAGYIDKNNFRKSQAGMFEQLRKDTDNPLGLLSPQDKALLENSPIGKVIDLSVIKYDPSNYVLTETAPATLEPVETQLETGKVNVTWRDVSFNIFINKDEHVNNSVDAQQKLEKQLLAWEEAVVGKIDADGITAINTAKTQALSKNFGITFDGTSKTLNFAADEDVKVYGATGRMFEANNYAGSRTMVGNAGIAYMTDQLMKLSDYNAINEALQLQGWSMATTNRIADAVGKKATAYAMIDGYTALLTQTAAAYKNGTTSGKGEEWSTMQLPTSGITANVFYRDGAVIKTGTDSSISNQMVWTFWVRYAIVTPALDYADKNPFIKLDVAE